MTWRPIHRWKSWWLGVFVVGFLAWAGWDSTRFHSAFVCRQMGFGNMGGGAALAYYSDSKPGSRWFDWGRYDMRRSDLTSSVFEAPLWCRGGGMDFAYTSEDALPKTYRGINAFRMRTSPRESWLIFIPHWLVMLVFMVPWAGFLVWKAKRQRKARRQRNLTA